MISLVKSTMFYPLFLWFVKWRQGYTLRWSLFLKAGGLSAEMAAGHSGGCGETMGMQTTLLLIPGLDNSVVDQNARSLLITDKLGS